MGAKKNFLDIFKKEKIEAGATTARKKHDKETPAHIQKIEIENLKKSIEDKLRKDPEMAKKAAQIISEMLGKK